MGGTTPGFGKFQNHARSKSNSNFSLGNKGTQSFKKPTKLMSVVEEESNADDDNEEGIMYTLSHFEGILLKWWSTADQDKGNVTLSADKLSQTLLLDDVFKE